MSNTIYTKFVIVGAGITGLSMAIACQLNGYEYLIIEKSNLVKGIGAGIGITSNAIEALRRLGLDNQIKEISNPLNSLQIVDQNGSIINDGNPSQIPDYDATNYAIHRATLHECLLKNIDSSFIYSNTTVSKIEKIKDKMHIHLHNNRQILCDYVIGADGIHSTIRPYVAPNSSLRFAGYTCWRAIVDLKLSDHHLSKETWGKKGRFGITPLKNNQVYWYACVNTKIERDPVFSNYKIENIFSNFKNYHSVIPEIISQTKDEKLLLNDIIDLAPINKYFKDKVILMGDAAHATTPNLGQGACMGLEDVVTFWEYFDENDFEKGMTEWNNKRVNRCKKLVNIARSIGQIAQWSQPALINLRNKSLRITPNFIKNQQLDFILNTDNIFKYKNNSAL